MFVHGGDDDIFATFGKEAWCFEYGEAERWIDCDVEDVEDVVFVGEFIVVEVGCGFVVVLVRFHTFFSIYKIILSQLLIFISWFFEY